MEINLLDPLKFIYTYINIIEKIYQHFYKFISVLIQHIENIDENLNLKKLKKYSYWILFRRIILNNMTVQTDSKTEIWFGRKYIETGSFSPTSHSIQL